MFERFTDRSRRVLVLAQEEARLLNHSFIGTEHILLGLIQERDGLAARALLNLDISLHEARLQIEEVVGMVGSVPGGSPPFTPRAKKVLELSLREALQLGDSDIGTEHLLLGLIREGDGVAVQVLHSLGCDVGQVHDEVARLISEQQETSGSPALERAELEKRVHILDAILDALERMDEINVAVRKCQDRIEARAVLQAEPFGYSPTVATHVLDLSVSRQTRAGIEEVRRERQQASVRLKGL